MEIGDARVENQPYGRETGTSFKVMISNNPSAMAPKPLVFYLLNKTVATSLIVVAVTLKQLIHPIRV